MAYTPPYNEPHPSTELMAYTLSPNSSFDGLQESIKVEPSSSPLPLPSQAPLSLPPQVPLSLPLQAPLSLPPLSPPPHIFAGPPLPPYQSPLQSSSPPPSKRPRPNSSGDLSEAFVDLANRRNRLIGRMIREGKKEYSGVMSRLSKLEDDMTFVKKSVLETNELTKRILYILDN